MYICKIVEKSFFNLKIIWKRIYSNCFLYIKWFLLIKNFSLIRDTSEEIEQKCYFTISLIKFNDYYLLNFYNNILYFFYCKINLLIADIDIDFRFCEFLSVSTSYNLFMPLVQQNQNKFRRQNVSPDCCFFRWCKICPSY